MHRIRPSGIRLKATRFLMSLVMLVGSGAGLLVATAQPASAADCDSATCAGRDPSVTSCAGDGRTILFRDFKAENYASFRIEVRYSPSCRAAWGRLTVWSGNSVGFALSAWNPNSPSVGTVGRNGNMSWTRMIDGVPPDCAGSHFYVNGGWVRWYYIGCV